MDIEDYISSGVLELYATGALTPAEEAEVEQLAAQYPAIQEELHIINQTLDRYAELHAVAPPSTLKDKVLQAVFTTSTLQAVPPDTGTNNNFNIPEGRVVPINRQENQDAAKVAFKWLMAASVVLLIGSNILSFYFYNNWQAAKQDLFIARNTQQQYADNIQQVRQKLAVNQQMLALLSDTRTERVELNGLEKAPDARVTIFWHRQTKNVYLNVENLPAPPTDKQYQLWALVDGKPVNAGLIDGPDITANLHHMQDVQQAQAFAITLEPKGGSVNPTLDEMYVMGKI